MASLETLTRRNNNARKFHHTTKIHRSCLRPNFHDTPAHMFENIIQAIKVFYQGHEFLTEAELENKSRRYDVYDLDAGKIIETETNPTILKSDADETIYFQKKCCYCGQKAIFISMLLNFQWDNKIKITRSYKCVACGRYTMFPEMIAKSL